MRTGIALINPFTGRRIEVTEENVERIPGVSMVIGDGPGPGRFVGNDPFMQQLHEDFAKSFRQSMPGENGITINVGDQVECWNNRGLITYGKVTEMCCDAQGLKTYYVTFRTTEGMDDGIFCQAVKAGTPIPPAPPEPDPEPESKRWSPMGEDYDDDDDCGDGWGPL